MLAGARRRHPPRRARSIHATKLPLKPRFAAVHLIVTAKNGQFRWSSLGARLGVIGADRYWIA